MKGLVYNFISSHLVGSNGTQAKSGQCRIGNEFNWEGF